MKTSKQKLINKKDLKVHTCIYYIHKWIIDFSNIDNEFVFNITRVLCIFSAMASLSDRMSARFLVPSTFLKM